MFFPSVFEAQRNSKLPVHLQKKLIQNEEEGNVFSPHQRFGKGNLNYVPKHLFTSYVVFVEWLEDLRVQGKERF